MNVLTIIIDELSKHANDQAKLAVDPNLPDDMRDHASLHYGSLLLVITALNTARARLIESELKRFESMLQEAAPPGANPKIHPSMQQPGLVPPAVPHLTVVKEEPDDA